MLQTYYAFYWEANLLTLESETHLKHYVIGPHLKITVHQCESYLYRKNRWFTLFDANNEEIQNILIEGLETD